MTRVSDKREHIIAGDVASELPNSRIHQALSRLDGNVGFKKEVGTELSAQCSQI